MQFWEFQIRWHAFAIVFITKISIKCQHLQPEIVHYIFSFSTALYLYLYRCFVQTINKHTISTTIIRLAANYHRIIFDTQTKSMQTICITIIKKK